LLKALVSRRSASSGVSSVTERPRLLKLSAPALGAALVLMALPGSAFAQATRTWVSGVGDDVNPCSYTAPCKTFAGAISKTAVGGEIDAQTPGGYGALTITKAITLDGGGGQVASILVSGTNGITVNAGAGARVIIRNLRFNGIGLGLSGISVLSAASVDVENCDIFGFSASGINFAPAAANTRAIVNNTTIYANGGSGINAAPTGTGTDRVTITNSQIESNGGNGVVAAGSGSPVSLVSTANSTISDNGGAGILTNGSTGLNIITGNVISGNHFGLQLQTAGVGLLISLGDNSIFGNDTDLGPGTPTSAITHHSRDTSGSRLVRRAWATVLARSRAYRKHHHKRHVRH
jgi:hypothetical protein